MLDREEYVEQAYFFRTLGERMAQSQSTQDLLVAVRDEILATTKLPMAIDYLASELKLSGVFWTAMKKLDHYFTPFQTYVVSEAERETGQFDLRVALEILRREAEYRAEGITCQGIFLYEFESLCRNRLNYDYGLDAIAADPTFDPSWREWILFVRRQVGIIELADLLYTRSQHCLDAQSRRGHKSGSSEQNEPRQTILFGEKEGRIALANRQKDPLYLFSALQRHLGYPSVPRPKPANETPNLIPTLMRRVQKLEMRLQLIEEEHRGSLDLTQFYEKKS